MGYERKLRALHLNAHQLSTATDLREVYDVTLETMEYTLGLSRASILIVEGEVLRQVAQSDQLTSGVELPLDGKGVTVRAVMEGKPIHVPDVREYEDHVYARDLPGFEAEEDSVDSLAELVVPIIGNGQSIGVLNIESVELDAFDDYDIQLLELLASHSALAISRLRNLEGLKASEERFRGITERSFDIIYTADPDGRLTYVSPSVERVLAYCPEEMIGKPFQTFFPGSEIPRAVQGFTERIRGESGIGVEYEMLRKDGATVFVEANSSPVYLDGEVVGAQGVVRDTTERKRAEERIRELAYRLNDLEPGGCFMSDSHERCLKAYADRSIHGIPGLCIVREDPEKLLKKYGLEQEEVLILSSRPVMGFQALSDLQAVSRSISESLQTGVGVVLLDGLEYLVNRFGFDPVFTLLQEKRFDFLEAGALLLIPVTLEAVSERERSLLLSELRMLQ